MLNSTKRNFENVVDCCMQVGTITRLTLNVSLVMVWTKCCND